MKGSRPTSAQRDLLPTLWLGWLVFVVYGSLVPLDFQGLPWEEALERFARIRLLDVGVQGRADWVANGVLYVPVGLLTTLVLAGRSRSRLLLTSVVALLLGLGLALAVEFSQLFFPPRTVSFNDLLAEGLGCLLGVLLAVLAAGRRAVVQARWRAQGFRLFSEGLPAGVLALIVASLFPFDVLISTGELADKLHGPFWGWWRAPLFANDGWGLTLARQLAEALLVVPLGAWWARLRLRREVIPSIVELVWQGMLLGTALGLALEITQWFLASGVSQGLSVFIRALGWGAGAFLGVLTAAWGVSEWRACLRRLTVPVVLCCLLAAFAKAGWITGPWLSVEEALQRLKGGEIQLLPFYYHYYTSEGAALQSVVPVLLLFAPFGLLCWAWIRSPWWGAGLATLLSASVEALRLFAVDARPDPSNVWIAGAAAYISAWALNRMYGSDIAVKAVNRLLPNASQSPTAQVPTNDFVSRAGYVLTDRLAMLWVSATGVCAFAWLWLFPVFQSWVGLMLAAAAALVWWRPVLLLSVAVAALPALNLTIWSGREFVDEYDVLLLVILVVAWARRSYVVSSSKRDHALKSALTLVALSLVASTLIGWAPWNWVALQYPDGPLSPWYSLRLFKGAVLAALLGWSAQRQIAEGKPVAQAFGAGMVAGLGGVLAVVMWERMVFVGLWNFASDYRVAGPVLPMRLGGAYLDTYLVVSLPFALVGALYGRNWLWRAACAATALGTGYAMAVTFTRSTYLAVAVAVLIVSVGVVRPLPRHGRAQLWLSGALMALLVMVAYPIITGPFASARMALVSQDMGTRLDHARHVISTRNADVVTAAFGQGLGRFPEQNYWTKQLSGGTSRGMAVHQFLRSEGVSQLQLGAGPLLFLDQAFSPQPGEMLRVNVRARVSGPKGGVTVMMCHKWLLASGFCKTQVFALAGPEKGWQEVSATINTGPLGADTDWLRKPIRLTLYNGGPVRVDVDSISVRDASGRELLRNGDFEAGSDHWSYTSDDHLAWHVKNMALAIWFDMGWIGVLAFSFLLALALKRSSRAAWSGDRSAQALLAALSGLLVVSVFDSVVDEPRFLLLLLLLVWLAATPAGPGKVTGRETLA